MNEAGKGMRSPKWRKPVDRREYETGQSAARPCPQEPSGDWRHVMLQQPDRPSDSLPSSATWALSGRGEAVIEARDHVREFLTASDRAVAPATLRDSLLVTSELVTNAVVHAPGLCVLHVGYHDGALAIAVRDASPILPTPRVPDPAAADGGFGWQLLRSLTSRIDVQPHGGAGKTITAVLRDVRLS